MASAYLLMVTEIPSLYTNVHMTSAPLNNVILSHNKRKRTQKYVKKFISEQKQIKFL